MIGQHTKNSAKVQNIEWISLYAKKKITINTIALTCVYNKGGDYLQHMHFVFRVILFIFCLEVLGYSYLKHAILTLYAFSVYYSNKFVRTYLPGLYKTPVDKSAVGILSMVSGLIVISGISLQYSFWTLNFLLYYVLVFTMTLFLTYCASNYVLMPLLEGNTTLLSEELPNKQ